VITVVGRDTDPAGGLATAGAVPAAEAVGAAGQVQAWVAGPGMQGIEVQPHTERNLTPECLSELLGGPDCVVPGAPPAFGVSDGRLPGPPDAYNENQPLPPPWYPQPGPPPGPSPGVIPGDPLGAISPAPAAAPAAAPAPAGPPLPAEAGGG